MNRDHPRRVHPEFTGNLLISSYISAYIVARDSYAYGAEPQLLITANNKGYTLLIAHCTTLRQTKGDPQVAHSEPCLLDYPATFFRGLRDTFASSSALDFFLCDFAATLSVL